ncbi:MAG: PQQ-binding-like beta-propeller repeat protein [Gammaproteobacteria bacterium]|nr:PQQ-binding-like beta-propeller repeat protein [Gammaproteobacteria bacterium]
MGRTLMRAALLAVVYAGAGLAGAAENADTLNPGEALYRQRCAGCHDNAVGRVPDTAALRTRAPEQIFAALRTGIMRPQSEDIPVFNLQGIVQYLTGREPPEVSASAPEPNTCPAPAPPLAIGADDWNGWSPDAVNTRYQPNPGLQVSDIPRLKLKWAFGYRGSYVYGAPVVVGGRVFATSSTGRVYALDARSGCVYWSFDGETATRSAVNVAPLPAGAPARFAAYFGDDNANYYAVDAESGRLLWKVRVHPHKYARITGSAKVYRGVLYVPVSALELVVAAERSYECCTFSGAVVALDARGGRILWSTSVLPPAQPYRKSDVGTQLHGPAGASVWNSPTIDTKLQRLYVGTGNSETEIEVTGSDAIFAMDLHSGAIVWSRQMLAGDNFNMACARPNACAPGQTCDLSGVNNCPKSPGPDVDFGAGTLLRTLKNGQRVLVASQKSGMVFGLDPDQGGKLLWQTRVGVGSPLGGIEWGSAASPTTVFAPNSDALVPREQAKPGLTALDLATGATRWHVDAPLARCNWSSSNCLNSFQQAASAMPGLVFAGSHDGWLRAYDERDGRLIWEIDTAQPYTTVNRVPASGGSLDMGGAAIAAGMVFVNSGYGRLVGRSGNVLLAFSVDGR